MNKGDFLYVQKETGNQVPKVLNISPLNTI